MKQRLFITTAGLALLLCSWQALTYARLKHRQQMITQQLSIMRQESRNPRERDLIENSGLQTAVSQAAQTAGIKQLFSLAFSGSGQDRKLNAEWEANPIATVRFLERLRAQQLTGACTKLEISLSRTRAAFELPRVFSRISGVPPVVSTVTFRNVFASPWVRQESSPQITLQKNAEKERITQEKERMAAEEEQRKRDEIAQTLAKKRELETQLVVTGIVNNGKEPMAFVSAKDAGRTAMVRRGDTIQDAQVTLIDEREGLVQLDYAGKFQLSLRLK